MQIFIIVENKYDLDHQDVLLIRAGVSEESCKSSAVLNFKRYKPGADDFSAVNNVQREIYNQIKNGNMINLGESTSSSKLNIFCILEYAELIVTHNSEIPGVDLTKVPIGTGLTGRIDFTGNDVYGISYPVKSTQGVALVAQLVAAIPDALVNWDSFNISQILNTNLIELLIFFPHTPPAHLLEEYNYDAEEWGLREIWFLTYDLVTGERTLKVATREPFEILNSPKLPIGATRLIPMSVLHKDGTIDRSISFIMHDNVTNRTGYNTLNDYALQLGFSPIMNHPPGSSVAYELSYNADQVVTKIRVFVFGLTIDAMETYVKGTL